MRGTSCASPISVRVRTRLLQPRAAGEDPVHDRQGRIPGFRQGALRGAKVLLIGAGGLGGEVGEGLARKGVGHLTILDPQLVQLSDLNRQRFYPEDLYRPKAHALAQNLAREATGRSTIVGYAISFQEAVNRGIPFPVAVVVCGVDSDTTRLTVARHFLRQCPVVFLGVDAIADRGYVFVQERGGPCLACAFPHLLTRAEGAPCAKAGAVKDILKVVAGIALYAVDTLLMPRRRAWNFREITLAGFVPDVSRRIGKREGCPVCGGGAEPGPP